jgi:hypothetical protein
MSGRVEINMLARRTCRSLAATTIAAMKLVDVARGLGFRSAGIQQSRVPGSKSRYVLAVDSLGRGWSIRISTHRKPSDAPVHHFEVLARKGVLDLTDASAFLTRAAAGDERWWDSDATTRHRSKQQREKWGRR